MQPTHPPSPIVVLGEALVDLFVPRAGVTLARAPHLVPRTGGAPANVAVQLARLGVPVRLFTAVGDDALGGRLRDDLAREGVDVRDVVTLAGRKTGLTFVEVDARGERRFIPRRELAADQAVVPAHFPLARLPGDAILHHGTVSLRTESARRTTRAAVRAVRKAGGMVSVDVNLRFAMYASRDALLTLARGALARAHVVKATRDEAQLLVGGRDLDAIVDRLLDRGPTLALLTLDAEGAIVATPHARVRVPTPRVRVVDATGAGDAFMGAALASLWSLGVTPSSLSALSARELTRLGTRACRAGARAVTALGATTAMMRSPGARRPARGA